MVDRVVRDLPAGTITELSQQHVRPFHLVKIKFEEGLYYVSEGPEITFETSVYLEGRCVLGQFEWTPDGQQSGTLVLLNEDNAASALALNNKVTGAEVTVYLVYEKTDGSFTTPEVYAKGVLDSPSIEPDQVVADIVTTGAGSMFYPNQVFSQFNGFNHLPVPGTIITWEGERYELEASD